MKLSKPRQLALRYFLAIETDTIHMGKGHLRRIPHPGARVCASLLDLKLIERTNWNYGWNHGLTDEGRRLAVEAELKALPTLGEDGEVRT